MFFILVQLHAEIIWNTMCKILHALIPLSSLAYLLVSDKTF